MWRGCIANTLGVKLLEEVEDSGRGVRSIAYMDQCDGCQSLKSPRYWILYGFPIHTSLDPLRIPYQYVHLISSCESYMEPCPPGVLDRPQSPLSLDTEPWFLLSV